MAGWPSIDVERVSWDLDPGPGSRTARRRHRGPYLAAVVPEIASAELDLPADVFATLEDASLEVARFDSECGSEISPFAALLLRSEAAASSQIEDLTASARAIAEAEAGVSARHNALSIVGNVRALVAAVDLADRIDAGTILAMHDALLRPTAPRIAGRWRDQQVWIGGSALGPHEAAFVPPRHERVPAAVDDLVRFAARDDLPVLAHAALAHAQFETIHPFPDGNGRTGRALLQSMLRAKRLTRNVTVPVSAGLLTDTAGYFAALAAYQQGDPQPIVDRLAQACFAAVENGRRLVTDLRALRADWEDRIEARRGAAAWRLADLVLRRPVVTSSVVAAELDVTATNVYRAIEPLVQAGVLVEFSDRQRNRAWRCPEVLELLDEFAARAGRRSVE